MNQAYEYKTESNATAATFAGLLATDDADGWEAIGYSVGFTPGGVLTYSALLRRRV